MNNFVKLYDTVHITPSSVERFTDSLISGQGSGRVLRVDIVATHAGRLTRNHGFYLPQKMKDGVASLFESYNKPILVHHNAHQDPIGRIVAAKYIDTAMTIQRNSKLDSVIKDLCNPKTSFFHCLSLIDQLAESDLIKDPSYPGLGHILATVDITDEDAIRKILDKRFLTVSIGASTDKAVCSICKQDWVEEGPCEHRPGKVYDEKLAFIVAGKLGYDEISFVNVPADTLARVVLIHNGVATDSMLVEESNQTCNVNASFFFTDALSVQSGGTQVIDTPAETAPVVPASEPVPVEPVAPVADPQDAVAITESPAETVPDESDKHYEDMVAFGYTLSLFDEDFADAKLSSEQRKKMKTETFCKPGERKYPVNDCNHAKAAMAYAKKNNEAASVVACIRRKAKALGCPFNGEKDAFDKWVAEELDVILADLASKEVPANTEERPTETPKEQAPCVTCDDKAKDETIAALRQEIEDANAENERQLQGHVAQLDKTKIALADTVVRLDMISGVKVDSFEDTVNQTASMALEELLNKVSGLQDKLDMKVIVEKVQNGMARVPDGTVADPTATISDGGAQDTIGTEDAYKGYREKYLKVLEKNGQNMANQFVQKLIQARLVPNDFNPENP